MAKSKERVKTRIEDEVALLWDKASPDLIHSVHSVYKRHTDLHEDLHRLLRSINSIDVEVSSEVLDGVLYLDAYGKLRFSLKKVSFDKKKLCILGSSNFGLCGWSVGSEEELTNKEVCWSCIRLYNNLDDIKSVCNLR